MSKAAKRRARAQGAGQQPAPAAPSQALGPQSLAEGRTPILAGNFVPATDIVVDFEPDPRLVAHEVDVRQLGLLVRDWRKGRATRTLWQALTDGYIAIFTLVMVGAMLVNLILEAQRLASGQVATAGSSAARALLPWAAMFAAMASALMLSRMFGPVLASAAEGFWMLEAPLQRGRLLARRLWSIIVVTGVAGGAFGALVAALTGSSWIGVLAWAAGTGLATAAMTAFTAVRQGAERTWPVQLAQGILSAAGVVALVAVVAVAVGWLDVHIGSDRGDVFAMIVGAFGLVVSVVAGITARRRLDALRRVDLVSGGSLASGLQGAMFALDFGLMRDILTERRAMRKGRVQPTRGRGLGASTLMWRDVQRLVRDPSPLILLGVSVIVPYAVQALGLGPLAAPLSAIVLMAALIPFMGSLRVLSRTKGLARCMPLSTSQIRTATTVVPTVLAVIWAVAIALAFIGLHPKGANDVIDGLVIAGLTAAAGLLGSLRWVTARPPDYSGPMVATQMGAMPPGMMMNLVRGFDLIALITLPLVFSWTPWISVTIAVIAWMVLRSGSIDRDEILEQAAEQKRQAAEARAPKPKEKIKVPRSGR